MPKFIGLPTVHKGRILIGQMSINSPPVKIQIKARLGNLVFLCEETTDRNSKWTIMGVPTEKEDDLPLLPSWVRDMAVDRKNLSPTYERPLEK